MRVGMTTFGGDGGKSGISRYLMSLFPELVRMDPSSEFDVYGYEDEKSLFVPDAPNVKAILFGRKFASPAKNILWHQLMLPGYCKRNKYDVLFLPAGNRRLPLRSPCPTVGTVHDFSSIHVPGKYDDKRMFYILKVLPFLIRRLTQVLTVSESSKKDIVEFARVPEHLVTVTPLAADTRVYYPGDPEEAAAAVCPKYKIRRPYVLYISRIEHPGKNHARLIQAFEKAKKKYAFPHQLVLAGGDWDRAAEVHKVADESSVREDILFTGFTAGGDMGNLYRAADLFVFPSLYEGFGLPVLEAMCCGVPVACSNVSSIPEVAGREGMLFDPYDVDAMAEVIGVMLADAALRKRVADTGFIRSKSFSWERTARLTWDVLLKAAQER